MNIQNKVMSVYRVLLALLISIAILTNITNYAMIILTWLWIFERPIENRIIKVIFKIKEEVNEDE